MGDEAAGAAGHDTELDRGAARRLDADDGQRERMAGAPDDDPVEQQVVDDRPAQRPGSRPNGCIREP
jgi:hypothetical protein